MSSQMKVRLYATCELRVHVDTEIDLVEFIKASPDDEYEVSAQFPAASANQHEVMSFDIDEAEVLPEGGR